MLFLIFDLEVVFLYPWAIYFRQLGVFGLVQMGIFLIDSGHRLRLRVEKGRAGVGLILHD